jgi:aspartyl-tRNA(Asn)/glutamyl-tRNA(Gln) amidotransferase subunit C
MSSIIGFIEQLNELDTSEIDPLHHVLDLSSVMREDVVTESLPVTEVLKKAPLIKGDYILVPKVIKDSVE